VSGNHPGAQPSDELQDCTDIYRTCSVEKKEQALKKMMATVLKDKSMIEDTIVELDRYKRDALTKTWEKVNG
jgi:chromosome segregation ATPase